LSGIGALLSSVVAAGLVAAPVPPAADPVAAAPATTPAAPGPAEVWQIMREETAATFRVRLFAIMPLNGRFADVQGTVTLDRARGEAQVSAVIGADSIEMNDPDNTEWVRSAEFFDSARYPQIRFESAPFPLGTLQTGGELNGELSLRGRTEPVAFEVEPGTCGTPAAERCEVEVEGAIRRSVFGMLARRGAVSDRVQLRFKIVARRESADGASS
jgi:polyisoprenoid-binding protein YceI